MRRGMLVKETAEHAIRLFESAAFSSVFFFPDVIFGKDNTFIHNLRLDLMTTHYTFTSFCSITNADTGYDRLELSVQTRQ